MLKGHISNFRGKTFLKLKLYQFLYKTHSKLQNQITHIIK